MNLRAFALTLTLAFALLLLFLLLLLLLLLFCALTHGPRAEHGGLCGRRPPEIARVVTIGRANPAWRGSFYRATQNQ